MRYLIDDLELDAGKRQLSRQGTPIELGRLTYALLLALVEAAPNVVDHDRIIERVWQGRPTSPETVMQRIKLLRKALGDDAEEPRYIGLVRGQGYRLLPTCRRLPPVGMDETVVAAAARHPLARPALRAGAALGVLAAFAALAVWAFALSDWRSGEATETLSGQGSTETLAAMPRSIAILPFENLESQPARPAFGAGFYQTLLGELSAISELTVISGATMQLYADREVSPAEIARELRVEAVMYGSAQFDGDNVRVTVSIVQPDTGTQLWGQSYDREIGDVLAIQTDIALSIAGQLRARVLPAERQRIESPPTSSDEAYALYVETLVDTDRRRLPLEDDRSRLPLLNRAIELDPNFAAAYVARADIYTWAVAYSEAGSSPAEIARQADYTARALADADRALEIDPTLAGAWIVRGVLDLEYWRWAEAEAHFARALELAPNDPDVLLQTAFFEAYAGRPDRSLDLARRRFMLDPLSVESNNGLGFIAIVAGESQTALDRYAEVARLVPGIWFYHTTAALALRQQGDRAGAEEALRTADKLRVADDLGVFLANSANVYRWLGLNEDAERSFRSFASWAEENIVGEGDWVIAYLGIGDYENARAALERAVAKVENHQPDSHQALVYVAVNAMRDPMLEEPEFRELRARLMP